MGNGPSNLRRDNWQCLASTLTDFVSHLTLLSLASTEGVVKRTMRMGSRYQEIELARWRSLAESQSVWDAVSTQTRIASEFNDAWMEEVRNLVQVTLMNCANLQDLSDRIVRRWLDAVTDPASSST